MSGIEKSVAHYGIPGMRWGKRKSRNLNDQDVVVKKGTVIKRMSDSKEIKPRDYIYAAYKKKDVDAYMYSLQSKYQISFKAKDLLISPSEKKRVDIFLDIYKKNPQKIANEMAQYKKDSSYFALRSKNAYAKTYLKMAEAQLKDKGYKVFASSLVSSKHNRDSFFNEVKKKGYNMVLDDNDVRNTTAKHPLIIFEHTKSLQRTGHKVVKESDIDAAFNRVIQEEGSRLAKFVNKER